MTSEWLGSKRDQNTWGNHICDLNIRSKWSECYSYHETDNNYKWNQRDLKVTVIMKQMAIISDMKITSMWLKSNSYHDQCSRHDICQMFYTSTVSQILKFTQKKCVICDILDS